MRNYRNRYRNAVETLVLAGALAAAGFVTAAAQEPDGQLEEVVVTASRLGVGLPGTSTTVIEAEDIARSPATTLPDLLSREAGVQSRDFYSASGADSAVDIRGFGATASSNTLVLVNGRRLNDFDLAGVDWSNIPLESIERIEITRGNAGAVLYGDGAVGGVVNIVTKTAVPQGPSGKVSAKYGSYQHRETNVSATHGAGDVSLSAYGTLIDAQNYRDNNDLTQRNLVTEARRRTDEGQVYVNLGVDDQRLGTPGARRVTLTSTQLEPESVRRQATTPDDYTRQNGVALTVGGTRRITKNVEAVLDAGYRIKDTEARTVSNFGPQFDAYVDTELATFSLTPRLNIDADLWRRPTDTTLGIDYYYSDYNSDRQLSPDGAAYHRYDGKQHSAALYAQNTLAFSDTLDLSAGGRVQSTRFTAGDIYDPSLLAFPAFDGHRESLTDTSNDFALNAGLDYRLTDSVALFGRVARSFRAPTVDERVGSDPSHKSFVLKTQTSRDAEVGTRLSFGKVEVQSSAYYMALRDELHYDPDSGVNKNFDPTRRYGVENSLDWRATETVGVKANLTYTKAEFTDGPYKGNTVPLVSDWTASTSLSWDMVEKYLTGTATVSYYSSQNMENDEANFQPEMPGYTLVDLKLGGEYNALTWSATVNNVLDVDYYNYAVASSTAYGTFNAYPLPGRTYWLEAGVTF
ncbi:TonB-dependent receptor [Shumkonia mesophila]|uniref:TonB-dependent receptor n=1 Tax=Shumkonia mesophila TaxID=2838854 RepID=UPI00293435D9|nr:TonB-dependent receptor [Shumkonia mesophila]